MTDLTCTRCGGLKPPAAFPRNSTKASGRDSECRRCKHARENTPEAREARRYRSILNRYGITKEQYERLHQKQGGRCAICKEPESRKDRWGERVPLSVDHNHHTGKHRGLLCHACNKGIGLLGEDRTRIFNSYLYILQGGA